MNYYGKKEGKHAPPASTPARSATVSVKVKYGCFQWPTLGAHTISTIFLNWAQLRTVSSLFIKAHQCNWRPTIYRRLKIKQRGGGSSGNTLQRWIIQSVRFAVGRFYSVTRQVSPQFGMRHPRSSYLMSSRHSAQKEQWGREDSNFACCVVGSGTWRAASIFKWRIGGKVKPGAYAEICWEGGKWLLANFTGQLR